MSEKEFIKSALLGVAIGTVIIVAITWLSAVTA